MTDIHDCPDCHMRPGSDTAIEAGCTCGPLDNGHGHRSPFNVIAGNCPVHALTTREDEDDD